MGQYRAGQAILFYFIFLGQAILEEEKHLEILRGKKPTRPGCVQS